ncbi:(2Fe-2S) ferredoxin domain-containing protein [Streptomyces sp900129855]|uniref:(2Fe-2S) ferredoxin domain-containing protein n=1 Tax=Streptomyces sp. 900129855 TaxID=3155129 RepID=A0ABV2ZP54_9ACTN
MDHEGIAEILTHHSGPDTALVRTECLWACELSNVVVVNPSTEARHAGTRPAWITQVNTVERAEALAAWLRDGGPGIAEPPPELGRIRTGAEIARTGTSPW